MTNIMIFATSHLIMGIITVFVPNWLTLLFHKEESPDDDSRIDSRYRRTRLRSSIGLAVLFGMTIFILRCTNYFCFEDIPTLSNYFISLFGWGYLGIVLAIFVLFDTDDYKNMKKYGIHGIAIILITLTIISLKTLS